MITAGGTCSSNEGNKSELIRPLINSMLQGLSLFAAAHGAKKLCSLNTTIHYCSVSQPGVRATSLGVMRTIVE
jgi:hypothetical protein